MISYSRGPARPGSAAASSVRMPDAQKLHDPITEHGKQNHDGLQFLNSQYLETPELKNSDIIPSVLPDQACGSPLPERRPQRHSQARPL